VYPKHKSSTLLGLFMRCGSGSEGDLGEDPEGEVAAVTVSVNAWALRPIVISNATLV